MLLFEIKTLNCSFPVTGLTLCQATTMWTLKPRLERFTFNRLFDRDVILRLVSVFLVFLKIDQVVKSWENHVDAGEMLISTYNALIQPSFFVILCGAVVEKASLKSFKNPKIRWLVFLPSQIMTVTQINWSMTLDRKTLNHQRMVSKSVLMYNTLHFYKTTCKWI